MGSVGLSSVTEVMSYFALAEALDLDQATDTEIYNLAVTAVQFRDSVQDLDSTERSLRDVISSRLRRGWFSKSWEPSPQSRYSVERPHCGAHDPGSLKNGGVDKPVLAMWTSSFLPDGSSAWLPMEELTGPPGRRPLWMLSFADHHISVCNINSWNDYRELIERFPNLQFPGIVAIDWLAVSEVFDAVHLSACGLIETHGRVDYMEGRRFRLRGWDAECTAWLSAPREMSIERVEE